MGAGHLKILQILEATLGGTARHVLDLCAGLRGSAHEVHLIFNCRADRMDEIFKRGLPGLERLGVVCLPMDMPRQVAPLDGRVILSIRRHIREQGPFDVIHGHSSKGGAYAGTAAWGLPGVRIYTPHAFITIDPQLGFGARLGYGLAERALARLIHGLIAVSEEESQHARALGVPSRKLWVVPNGADVPVGSSRLSRSGLGLPERALLIGYVGRLVPQKAPENLLRAFALAALRFADMRLAMVGSGPLEESLRREARDLGIEAKTHWLGVQDGPAVMALFDVVALPSRYEGLPYVLLEAMALGLPIVTTAIGGAGTLIGDGENGFIVPPEQPQALAEALSKLAADAGLRRRMGEASRRRSGDFGAARMVAGCLAVYEKCVRSAARKALDLS